MSRVLLMLFTASMWPQPETCWLRWLLWKRRQGSRCSPVRQIYMVTPVESSKKRRFQIPIMIMPSASWPWSIWPISGAIAFLLRLSGHSITRGADRRHLSSFPNLFSTSVKNFPSLSWATLMLCANLVMFGMWLPFTFDLLR